MYSFFPEIVYGIAVDMLKFQYMCLVNMRKIEIQTER